ncbi:hypothetical protein [Streptomyces sp. NPDC017964]|uniref:hypothetical protein n=1 Tax=Streptomyces sp. NPDC017964 TaxID=3365022 RepID=UPI0037A2181F
MPSIPERAAGDRWFYAEPNLTSKRPNFKQATRQMAFLDTATGVLVWQAGAVTLDLGAASVTDILTAVYATIPADVERIYITAGGPWHRNAGRHQFLKDAVAEWLRERSERWARSVNPHLFVTQITALDPDGPEVAKYGLQPIFTELGLQPQKLRIDRLLDEAHETADPVHLMRVFGIADTTAMRYVQAAHSHRFAKDPTRP